MIVRVGKKFEVRSADGTKVLGTYDTRAAAQERLAQVEMFKAMRSKARGPGGSPGPKW